MPGRIEKYQGTADGLHRWQFRSSIGRVRFTSEGYVYAHDMDAAIVSVIQELPCAHVADIDPPDED